MESQDNSMVHYGVGEHWNGAWAKRNAKWGRRGPVWHKIDSVRASRVITACGREMTAGPGKGLFLQQEEPAPADQCGQCWVHA